MRPPGDEFEDDFRNAWRCGACDALMYNVEFLPATRKLPFRVHPRQGAPRPQYLNEYGDVCNLCFFLYWNIVEHVKLKKAQDEWVAQQDNKKKNVNKLRPGNDYFMGA